MKKLQKGDKVAIVAPSGQIGNIEKISAGLEYLHKLGFVPVFGKHAFDQYRYMAGTDMQRAEDINVAFSDDEIKAVFCVRAAAGATRILPYIDYQTIRKNSKPLIGFCDNAALQIALFEKSDIVSWNGFLLSYDFRKTPLNKEIESSFENLVNGRPYSVNSGTTLRKGISEGKLICCNLSVLMKLAGTPYFPNLSGKILLLEDVHERIHKIDLMLQQLKQQPNFAKINGLIFGRFTDSTGDEEDGTIDDCLADFMEEVDVPTIKDFNFGHTDSREVLPLGGNVSLNADNCYLDILTY